MRPLRRAVLGLAVVLCGAAPAHPAAPAGGVAQPFAASIELSGTIDPATADWVERALEEAVDDGARLAVVRLDTPGGLDSSMRAIVQAILGAPLPVVVYVHPDGARAASAGLFVTIAADVAAMSPQTNIGAATPVSLGGGESDEVLGRKVRNDAAAYVRALAEVHGRNADLAEAMVRDAESVTAGVALRRNLIDAIAPSVPALLRFLDGYRVKGPKAQTLDTDGLRVEVRDMPLDVEVRQFLVNPSVAFLLLLGGLLLIGLELASPGLVGPGLFGTIALVLGLYGTAQLPVTVGGVLLLALGLGLLVAETQTGAGVLGVAGAAALVVGGLLLFDTDSEAFRVTVPVAIATGVVLAGLVLLAAGKVLSTRRLPPRGEPSELIGRVASVRAPFDPLGQVYVDGALWRARVAGPPPPVGSNVVIERVEGLTLHVRPVDRATGGTLDEPPPQEEGRP